MNKFKAGGKVKRVGYSHWPHQFGKEGEVYEVLKVNNNGIVVIEGMPSASTYDFEKVYTTPEGAIVSIGDKGIWWGIEYTLVKGPNPWEEDKPYWKGQGSSWNNLSCKGYTVIPKETKQTKEEQTMAKGAMFTETTTETKIKKVINKINTDYTYMSVAPYGEGRVEVVVGATYEDRCASIFSKQGLTELIEELTAVRDCLKD